MPQLLDADADLRLFRQYVFDDANAAADRFFPAYNRWLDAFASAIRYDTSPPGRDDPLVTAANADLQPYRTIPQTHDLETVAAIQQRTSLDFLAATLSQLFRGQPAQTRAAAADYLLRRYRIMLGRSESQ